jgi:Flp pilus assembly pilin Flp
VRGRRPGHGAAGQGLAEFAFILALVALAVIAALILLGTDLTAIVSNIGDILPQ